MPKEKSKGGRKRWKPSAEDLKLIESLAGRGFYEREIIQALGIGTDTFYKNKALNAEFSEAIKRGRLSAKRMLTSKLMELARNNNLGAIIFSLKAVHGMREGTIQEGGNSDPVFVDNGETKDEF